MRNSVLRLSAALLILIVFVMGVAAETATLTVSASQDGCKVKFDGKDIGITPLVLQAGPGTHKLVITAAKSKDVLEKDIELKAGERIIAFGDFSEKKLQIYRTEKEIAEFVEKAANFVKFREYYDKAVEYYDKKKLTWAIDSLEKALLYVKDKDAGELLITWRKERLPKGFVYIEGGKFMMGQATKTYTDDYRQYPEHPVIVSDFAIYQYEVTNDEFAAFVSAMKFKTTAEVKGSAYRYNKKKKMWELVEGIAWNHPTGPKSSIRGKGKYPVCQVSWSDAEAYCRWRSTIEGFPPDTIRLPTEAEWEYTARGTEGRSFPWGETPPIKDKGLANIENTKSKEVGKMRGVCRGSIYDMIGNVWEWCFDRGDDDYYRICKEKGVVTDPMGPSTGSLRVVRGGGYDSDEESARTVKRYFMDPQNQSQNIGFRIAMTP